MIQPGPRTAQRTQQLLVVVVAVTVAAILFTAVMLAYLISLGQA